MTAITGTGETVFPSFYTTGESAAWLTFWDQASSITGAREDTDSTTYRGLNEAIHVFEDGEEGLTIPILHTPPDEPLTPTVNPYVEQSFNPDEDVVDSPGVTGRSRAIRKLLDAPDIFDELTESAWDVGQLHGRSKAIHVRLLDTNPIPGSSDYPTNPLPEDLQDQLLFAYIDHYDDDKAPGTGIDPIITHDETDLAWWEGGNAYVGSGDSYEVADSALRITSGDLDFLVSAPPTMPFPIETDWTLYGRLAITTGGDPYVFDSTYSEYDNLTHGLNWTIPLPDYAEGDWLVIVITAQDLNSDVTAFDAPNEGDWTKQYQSGNGWAVCYLRQVPSGFSQTTVALSWHSFPITFGPDYGFIWAGSIRGAAAHQNAANYGEQPPYFNDRALVLAAVHNFSGGVSGVTTTGWTDVQVSGTAEAFGLGVAETIETDGYMDVPEWSPANQYRQIIGAFMAAT